MEMLFPAVLILGPTGSGKTPLGRELETRGLAGRRCRHFDFGAEMRALAGGDPEGVLTEEETTVVRRSLSEGTLLEDRDFPIAGKILDHFLRRGSAESNDLVILNGLPRHEGQAEALQVRVRIRMVVLLECPAETAALRIERDSGEDRGSRTDGHRQAVARRLKDYESRTRPLIEYYKDRGVVLIRLAVGPQDSGEIIFKNLHKHDGMARDAMSSGNIR
jgi:adenylate kinase